VFYAYLQKICRPDDVFVNTLSTRTSAEAHIDSASALLKDIKRADMDSCNQPTPRGALSQWRARRVLTFIDDNLSAKLRIEQLADLVALSPSYFMRAFRTRFRTTVRTYIEARRMDVAKELMLTTSATLTDIAHRCGMTDHPHFTRTFRRAVGEAPYRWRTARYDWLNAPQLQPPRLNGTSTESLARIPKA
jgi:AraC-like DNA-binding protein